MSRVSESLGLHIAICRIFIKFGSGLLYKQSNMRDWPGSGPTGSHALLRGVNYLCVPAAFLDGSGYIRCKTCCTLCVSLVIMRAGKAAVLCCRRWRHIYPRNVKNALTKCVLWLTECSICSAVWIFSWQTVSQHCAVGTATAIRCLIV